MQALEPQEYQTIHDLLVVEPHPSGHGLPPDDEEHEDSQEDDMDEAGARLLRKHAGRQNAENNATALASVASACGHAS